MARGKRRFRLAAWFLLLLLAVLFFRWENTSLQVTECTHAFRNLPEEFDGFRIVVLGDLHTALFGEENGKLLETVGRQNPDCIALVGDLLDCFREAPPDYAAQLAEGLSGIAPTYCVTGNHEWAIGDVPALKQTLEDHGVTVLSNRFLTLERGGASLVLAGIDDPNGYAGQKTPEQVAEEVYAACGDSFWILLAHRNDHFPSQYSRLGADLVLSGHGHGGLIRLPFTDGLISTSRTFFPSYTAGIYEEHGSTLFVTRGLGNSGKTFRLFNRPEVALLVLHKA